MNRNRTGRRHIRYENFIGIRKGKIRQNFRTCGNSTEKGALSDECHYAIGVPDKGSAVTSLIPPNSHLPHTHTPTHTHPHTE